MDCTISNEQSLSGSLRMRDDRRNGIVSGSTSVGVCCMEFSKRSLFSRSKLVAVIELE